MRIFFLLAAVVVGGCSSLGIKRLPLPSAVMLEFKGKPGVVTQTRYYSKSQVRSYEADQMLRDRMEAVDFVVASTVTAAAAGTVNFTAKTVAKDGTIALHELAFPELNEEIAYKIQSDGKVLKAGEFPPQSLFFVPALPMPRKPVEVGDTWTMEHTWLSARDGIPLRLETVAILKAIVACGSSDFCADLEISGAVGLVVAPSTPGSRFTSRVWGRVLFSIGRGDVVWSEMRSAENMMVQNTRMSVRSCMVSEARSAAQFKIKFDCDPSVDAVSATPVF